MTVSISKKKPSDSKEEQNRRKAKQRERERELDAEKVEAFGVVSKQFALSKTEANKLALARRIRGGESPYEEDEYIATLIRNDYERLLQQQEVWDGVTCELCGKKPPEGCQGLAQGQSDCWLTEGYKEVRLHA